MITSWNEYCFSSFLRTNIFISLVEISLHQRYQCVFSLFLCRVILSSGISGLTNLFQYAPVCSPCKDSYWCYICLEAKKLLQQWFWQMMYLAKWSFLRLSLFKSVWRTTVNLSELRMQCQFSQLLFFTFLWWAQQGLQQDCNSSLNKFCDGKPW